MVLTSLLFRRIPILFAVLLLSFSLPSSVRAFQSSAQVDAAKQRLQTMSPEEINRKIREMGMTRTEAERRAKENGIDLSTYLQSNSGVVTPAQTQIIIESGSKTPAPAPEKPASEETPAKKVNHPTSKGLKYFGYDIFDNAPASFQPESSGPVDPEYIVGPEDVLRVSVWGQVEQQNELTVDKDGRIFIPTAGPVVVSGMTVDEVQKTLVRQLSRSFQGLSSNPKTVWMDVTLAKIRPKRVFIMGEVVNPGGYTVSSYANIFNSLFAVGGPTVNGSLRDVRLIRGNKTVARIDLYSYLLGSDKNNDVRVQNNDIIYVPVRKGRAYIRGEVRRPGIYELLPGENLKKLLEYAGGTLTTSYLERVQLERIIPLKDRTKNGPEQTIIDIDYRDLLTRNTDYTILDDDLFTFFPILGERNDIVTIGGAVFKPGLFQWSPGMRVMDLVTLADSLRPEAYLLRGDIVRLEPDLQAQVTVPFDLGSAVKGSGAANVPLQARDQVIIHSKDITNTTEDFVEVFGSVKRPGRYSLTRGMTIIDLILNAGGYAENSNRTMGELSRMDSVATNDTLSSVIHVRLPDISDTVTVASYSYYENWRRNDFKLKHRDRLFVRPNAAFRPQPTVEIRGEIYYPGEYTLISERDYLSQFILRAGGPTISSYPAGGRIVRNRERVNVDIQKVMDGPKSENDIVLHPGDSIYIPKKPYTVRVVGEVHNPSVFGFVKGNDLYDYINRAGGFTDSSEYIILFQPNGFAERFRTGIFGGDAEVMDGSTILVTKIPAPPPDSKQVDVGNLIRDIFAITASALTILGLARQI